MQWKFFRGSCDDNLIDYRVSPTRFPSTNFPRRFPGLIPSQEPRNSNGKVLKMEILLRFPMLFFISSCCPVEPTKESNGIPFMYRKINELEIRLMIMEIRGIRNQEISSRSVDSPLCSPQLPAFRPMIYTPIRFPYLRSSPCDRCWCCL